MQIDLLPGGITTANGAPTAVQPAGTITVVAGASLNDGERILLHDGQTKLILEFDKDGKVAQPSGPPVTLVDVSGTPTATQVRDKIIAAINGGGHQLVASINAAAVLNVTHNLPGARGNMPIRHTVANGGFAVTGLSSGSLSGVPIARDIEIYEALKLKTTGCGAAPSLTVRLWGWWSDDPLVWLPFGPGTDAGKGVINGGNVIGASVPAGNDLRHEEMVAGMAMPDRVYPQVTGNFQGGTLFAKLTSRSQRKY